MNKNYVKGRNAEYKTIEYLEKKGYLAHRTAGSHSPVDVYAHLRSDRNNLDFLPVHLAVQVKKISPPTKQDELKLRNYPLPTDMLKAIYFWKKHARHPIIIEIPIEI